MQNIYLVLEFSRQNANFEEQLEIGVDLIMISGGPLAEYYEEIIRISGNIFLDVILRHSDYKLNQCR